MCEAAHKGKVAEAAADLDIERFAQRGQVAVERTAQALQHGVVDVFKLQVGGVAHGVFRVEFCIYGCGRLKNQGRLKGFRRP